MAPPEIPQQAPIAIENFNIWLEWLQDPANKEDVAMMAPQLPAIFADWGDVITAAKNYDMNLFPLPDGTVIPLGEIDDPALADALQLQNKMILENSLNGSGLATWRAQNEAIDAAFNDQLTVLNAKVGIEDTLADEQAQRIERALEGKDQARRRAEFTASLQGSLAGVTVPRGHDGNFSGRDLGALGVRGAELLGLDPDSTLLSYGTTTIDPNQLFDDFDAKLGVSGALPDVYDRTVGLDDVPGVPNRPGVPGGGGGGGTATDSLLDTFFARSEEAAAVRGAANQAGEIVGGGLPGVTEMPGDLQTIAAWLGRQTGGSRVPPNLPYENEPGPVPAGQAPAPSQQGSFLDSVVEPYQAAGSAIGNAAGSVYGALRGGKYSPFNPTPPWSR